MSTKLNPDWENKLKPFKADATIEEKTNIITIINQFKRDEIFYNNYDENSVFNHIYKENPQAKRQPNPFMIFRIILGLIANHNNTKLGDGTFQSKIAGHMWGGAAKDEKKRFENISINFKNLHKIKFPQYEYKPKARTPVAGTFAETITSSNYEQQRRNVVSNHQPIPQELLQQTPEDNSNMLNQAFLSLPLFENALDPTFMLNGDYPLQYQIYPYQLSVMDQLIPLNLTENQTMEKLDMKFENQTNQLNTLNTVNTLEMPFDYPLQSPPTIASNCINPSPFDPNQPNAAFNYHY